MRASNSAIGVSPSAPDDDHLGARACARARGSARTRPSVSCVSTSPSTITTSASPARGVKVAHHPLEQLVRALARRSAARLPRAGSGVAGWSELVLPDEMGGALGPGVALRRFARSGLKKATRMPRLSSARTRPSATRREARRRCRSEPDTRCGACAVLSAMGGTKRAASRAITSSSFVGTTSANSPELARCDAPSTRPAVLGVARRRRRERRARASSDNVCARTRAACSPMPPVNTSASRRSRPAHSPSTALASR